MEAATVQDNRTALRRVYRVETAMLMAVGQSGAVGVYVMFRVEPDTTSGTDYVKIRRQKTLASTVKDLKTKWANASTSLVQLTVGSVPGWRGVRVFLPLETDLRRAHVSVTTHNHCMEAETVREITHNSSSVVTATVQIKSLVRSMRR
ncbi:hypothetical protein DPMN_179251 [Dreissena polymorpha]|uniref:Uncharacterized protein n=1 Tax=Dreissena polymorpha TaxID=45954 RepID=A0A9D4EDN7_DREPO|nr:hypothetical protein DPMN_179251 [Dreissena polymorpha]